MDLLIYLGKIVYINLANGYYYSGKCLDADDTSITLLDKTGSKVSLSKDSILTIREVLK